MTNFTIHDSVSKIATPMYHYDAKAFADDLDWYRRFEQYVTPQNAALRIACAYDVANRGGTAKDTDQSPAIGNEPMNKLYNTPSVVLPLQRNVSSGGLSTLCSLDNYYSVDYRPLCANPEDRQHISSLLHHVLSMENPHRVCLRGLDPEAPETEVLLQALRDARWMPYVSTHQINWAHELAGDFDDYRASLPGRVKSTLKRKTNKLLGLEGASMTVHEGKHNIDELLLAYQHIYDNSWKVPEPHADFVPMLIRAVAEKGQLRLGLLNIGNVPIAVHFWVVRQEVAFIYKLAHDKEFDAYSPGTVLMGHMVQHVMQHDAVRRLDFLSGDDTYKQDWMSDRREKSQVIAYNPESVRAQMMRIRDEVGRPFVKQLARRLIPVRRSC